MVDDVTFQSSTLATPPADTVVATDDVAGKHYQRVKLDLGGDGAASPLVRGQQADASSIPVTLSTEQAAFLDTLESLLTSIKTAVEIVDNVVSGSEAQVDVVAALPAGTNNIGDVDVLTVPADPFGANADAAATAGSTGSIQAKLRLVTSQLDSIKTAVETLDNVVSGSEAQVDIVGSLPAGTNAIGKLAANSGVDIGDVDVTSVPADPFGANADAAATAGSTGSIQAKLRLMTSQLDSIKTAVETLDNAISGSEMQVDVVAALPAGTNAIGKLAANSGVDIGDVTLTAGTAAVGKLLPPDVDITTHTNYAKKYYTNAGAVTDGIVWSPAAGTRWHVTCLTVNVSAACTVTFEDDKSGGDEAVMKFEFAANSGVVIPFGEKYPWASGEDAADLIVTTTAGNIYITAVGYEI